MSVRVRLGGLGAPGLLLGGPAVVGSLMDVIGRGPAAVVAYSPRAPHPVPYLRTFLSSSSCAAWAGSIAIVRRAGLDLRNNLKFTS